METMDLQQEAISEMQMQVIEHSPAATMVELPEALNKIWGGNLELSVNPHGIEIPLVCANFVVSKEGVFNLKDTPGGGPISQGNRADAFGMALLRSYADAVMVGAGTVNGEPEHIWDMDFIFDKFPQMKGLEDLRREFKNFRAQSGNLTKSPPTFFVTNSGDIKFNAEVFKPEHGIETYVVTGERGAKRIRETNPAYKNVLVFGDEALDEVLMMKHLRSQMGIEFLLHEGGKTVMNSIVQRGLVSQFQVTAMSYSPAGDISEGNGQYLFDTPDHGIPANARVISRRRDATGNATIATLDFRDVRAM